MKNQNDTPVPAELAPSNETHSSTKGFKNKGGIFNVSMRVRATFCSRPLRSKKKPRLRCNGPGQRAVALGEASVRRGRTSEERCPPAQSPWNLQKPRACLLCHVPRRCSRAAGRPLLLVADAEGEPVGLGDGDLHELLRGGDRLLEFFLRRLKLGGLRLEPRPKTRQESRGNAPKARKRARKAVRALPKHENAPRQAAGTLPKHENAPCKKKAASASARKPPVSDSSYVLLLFPKSKIMIIFAIFVAIQRHAVSRDVSI